jgi:methyltransferase (TIGR00027 family)
MESVAATCRWIAAVRARESERPDRLFNDPYAAKLAGEAGFAFLDRMTAESPEGPQGTNIAYIVHRTRFLDDWMTEGVRQGLRQIVILAAGMDTRAFRLGFPADTRLYELDLPEVISVKEAALQESGAVPSCARKAIAVDLTTDWSKPLLAAGFDPAKPAIWLVEGLLMYLEEADVRRLLAAVSALAAPGSRISADLINGYFLKFRGTQRLLGYLEKIQAPWRFGTDEPETFFGEYGWKARALEPGELPFGRWHLKTYPREREGTSRMFFVTGEK